MQFDNMALSYYQNLANFLLSLQSQVPYLASSTQEEYYLNQAIQTIYQLTIWQIQELQNEG